MSLAEELERVAARAAAHAAPAERLAGVVASEPTSGERIYLCAFESDGGRAWLAFDAGGEPVTEWAAVRDAASIAAMCEVASEAAGGGALDDLRARLVALRISENPPGIEEAEAAALELERTVGSAPRLASPRYLDEVGAATRRLELALGGSSASPFAEAMRHAMAAVDALTADVERGYKLPLS